MTMLGVLTQKVRTLEKQIKQLQIFQQALESDRDMWITAVKATARADILEQAGILPQPTGTRPGQRGAAKPGRATHP